MSDSVKMTKSTTKEVANIALIGAGWWSQGWHLPHLSCHEKANIVAIVDASDQPQSSLNPHLESLSELSKRYGNCPIYKSVEDLLHLHPRHQLDGVMVCTPHATHYSIGQQLLDAAAHRRPSSSEEPAPPLHIFMEKPMTTNVKEAISLHQSVSLNNDNNNNGGCFMVNHSANYRTQAKMAKEVIDSGQIGPIRHVSAFFASPLSWIFDNPAQKGWNEPNPKDPSMLGNGFAWGQQSHLLAWIYHVCGSHVIPHKVFCTMDHSPITGADISHSATVLCETPGVHMNIAGTTLLPGNAHSDPPVAKLIRIEIFGTSGALLYSGDDCDVSSGQLELRKSDGSAQILNDQFVFENLDPTGSGPESLDNFIHACLGHQDDDVYIGADSTVAMRSVQTIDAMYRSHQSGKTESIMIPSPP